MPLVLARFAPDVPDEVVSAVVGAIPAALAEAFDCPDPGGDLTPKDIEVEVSTVGPKDINDYYVCVTVLANDFPTRKVNLDERRRKMQALLAPYIPPNMKGYLWTLLCPASFGEFHQPESTSATSSLAVSRTEDPNEPKKSEMIVVLKNYGLDGRMYNILTRYGVRVIRELLRCEAEELMRIRQFGRLSLWRLIAAVRAFGLEPPTDWVKCFGSADGK